jgi:helix-turn-helix protein
MLGGRGRKQLTGERMTRQDAQHMIDRPPCAPPGQSPHPARLPQVPGDRHHSPRQQREAIQQRCDDGEPFGSIARSYNVSPSAISRVTA